MINSMKVRTDEGYNNEEQAASCYSQQNGVTNEKSCYDEHNIFNQDGRDLYNPNLPPFPLSNILSRRLSNMSNFSSSASSTSSFENGVSSEDDGADNEDDSGEAYYKHHNRKKQSINTGKHAKCAIYDKPHGNTTRKDNLATTKGGKQHFKMIKKGVENILNSDILFKEDEENEVVDAEVKSGEHLGESDCSQDGLDIQDDLPKEPLMDEVSSKKKAKALINCFRSFAVKPT